MKLRYSTRKGPNITPPILRDGLTYHFITNAKASNLLIQSSAIKTQVDSADIEVMADHVLLTLEGRENLPALSMEFYGAIITAPSPSPFYTKQDLLNKGYVAIYVAP